MIPTKPYIVKRDYYPSYTPIPVIEDTNKAILDLENTVIGIIDHLQCEQSARYSLDTAVQNLQDAIPPDYIETCKLGKAKLKEVEKLLKQLEVVKEETRITLNEVENLANAVRNWLSSPEEKE